MAIKMKNKMVNKKEKFKEQTEFITIKKLLLNNSLKLWWVSWRSQGDWEKMLYSKIKREMSVAFYGFGDNNLNN